MSVCEREIHFLMCNVCVCVCDLTLNCFHAFFIQFVFALWHQPMLPTHDGIGAFLWCEQFIEEHVEQLDAVFFSIMEDGRKLGFGYINTTTCKAINISNRIL